jgi:hypothetical protein
VIWLFFGFELNEEREGTGRRGRRSGCSSVEIRLQTVTVSLASSLSSTKSKLNIFSNSVSSDTNIRNLSDTKQAFNIESLIADLREGEG